MTDYYEILGVPRDADEQTIKRAYRSLSLKWHPDKNNSEEAKGMYLQINEAYEVLKDSQKRHDYDRFGRDGPPQNGFPGGFPGDIFSQMFGGGFSFQFQQQRQEPQKVFRGPPKQVELQISITDMMNGFKKKATFQRRIKCPGCQATGWKPDAQPITCSACQGKGQIQELRRLGPMITQNITMCGKCSGKGKEYSSSDQCTTCHSQKWATQTVVAELEGHAGCKEGDQIVLAGQADEHENATHAGDLVMVLVEEKDAEQRWKRQGDHLYIHKKILLVEALTGLSLTLSHPIGKVIQYQTDQVIKPGERFCIPGLGFYNKDKQKSGDLVFDFEILFPEQLGPTRKEWLKKVLPKRKPQDEAVDEEYTLQKADPVNNTADTEEVEQNMEDVGDTQCVHQ